MHRLIAEIIDVTASRLREAGVEEAVLEARLLVGAGLGQSRVWLYQNLSTAVTLAQWKTIEVLTERRRQGEPLPYLLGEWEFFGRRFWVDPSVLIPRADTEILIETALAEASRIGARTVLDVGTGSGILAVTLALELPGSRVVALDLSREALDLARRNCVRFNVANRIHLIQGDLVAPIGGGIDLIVANLPYVPTAEISQSPSLREEPRLALDGGPNGLALYHRFFDQVALMAERPRSVLLEIGTDQAASVSALARVADPHATVTLHQDLEQRDRVVVIGQSVVDPIRVAKAKTKKLGSVT